jgi:methionine synthase II (cobalamin-independent)
VSSTERASAHDWIGAGWSTGVGSMPGTDPHEAAAVVAGEAGDLPHLVELPGRGPGADMVGRAAALLTDLHVDLQPSGWRLVDRPGTDERRGLSYLSHDLDELEGAHQGRTGAVKVQLCGPWTLAAALRLPRGEPVLSDAGAVRDLVQSLTDGAVQHLSDVRRRLPDAHLVLQLDEPSLPAVLAGGVRSSSGARGFAPVAAATVEETLRGVVDGAGVPVVVHCCAERPPVAILVRAGAVGLSLDLTVLAREVDDELGEAVDGDVALFAGVVPALPGGSGAMSDPAGTVKPVREVWRRLGLPVESLRRVVVTPTCGMAGADPAHARAALRLAADAARQLAEDPEG